MELSGTLGGRQTTLTQATNSPIALGSSQTPLPQMFLRKAFLHTSLFKNVGREPAKDVEFSHFQSGLGFVRSDGVPNIDEVNTCPYTKPLARESSVYADTDYRNDW